MAELDAVEQIKRLQAKYAFKIDSLDIDGVAEVFADDAEVYPGAESGSPVLHGIDKVRGYYQHVIEISKHLFHTTSNVVIDVEGDKAKATLYYYTMRVDLAGVTTAVTGRYDDEYARTDKGWQVTRRYSTPLIPRVVLVDPNKN